MSVASLAWTTSTSVAAIIVGTRAGSVTLIAFGLTGMLDAAGSAVLADHFDRHVRDSRRSRQSEALALRVISIGMYGVGISTAVESAWRLIRGSDTAATLAGPLIAGTSLFGLALLAHRKTVVAHRVDSAGLMADAHLTKIGLALAAVSLVGTGAADLWNWSWLDPTAALLIAAVAVTVGRVSAVEARWQ